MREGVELKTDEGSEAGPNISVVIPAYNARSYVRDAVSSALEQDLPPTEVIVVDDGSSDGTEALFDGALPTVKYVRQENAGVSAARNHGARIATGKWLAFLDADDLWDPAKLSSCIRALMENPEARWAFTFCSLMNPEGEWIPGGIDSVCEAFGVAGLSPTEFFEPNVRVENFRVRGGTVKTYFGDMFRFLFFGNVVIPSSVVIEKALFLELGGFDEGFSHAEETEFFHRAAASSPAVCVAAPLLKYRTMQSSSLSAGNNTARLVENALESLERARRLRARMSDGETAAYLTGRRGLLMKLAYAELSRLNREAARSRQLEAWEAGAPKTPRSLVVLLCSLLPIPVLRLLHRIKRGLSRP